MLASDRIGVWLYICIALQEYGLVLVTANDVPDPKSKTKPSPRGLLVTPEVAHILERMEGTLGKPVR